MASLLLLRETMSDLSEEFVDFVGSVFFALKYSQILIEVHYIRVLKVDLVYEFMRLATGCRCWQTHSSSAFSL